MSRIQIALLKTPAPTISRVGPYLPHNSLSQGSSTVFMVFDPCTKREVIRAVATTLLIPAPTKKRSALKTRCTSGSRKALSEWNARQGSHEDQGI